MRGALVLFESLSNSLEAHLKQASTAKIHTYTPIIQSTVYLFLFIYCKYLLVDLYKFLSCTFEASIGESSGIRWQPGMYISLLLLLLLLLLLYVYIYIYIHTCMYVHTRSHETSLGLSPRPIELGVQGCGVSGCGVSKCNFQNPSPISAA